MYKFYGEIRINSGVDKGRVTLEERQHRVLELRPVQHFFANAAEKNIEIVVRRRQPLMHRAFILVHPEPYPL